MIYAVDGGAVPDQAQVPAGQRQVQPRRLGDPDPGRRRGVAGVRTRAVPGLEFQAGWAYVIVMVVIGAVYLGYLLATRGRHGLTMPDMHSIDAELDARAPEQGLTHDHVLAIDQGTSGTKAIVVDEAGQVVSIAEVAVRPDYLAGGGVEQDPEALFDSVLDAGRRALAQAGVPVAAVALANQGETVLAWDRDTGRPLTPGGGLAGPPRRVDLRAARRRPPTPSRSAPVWCSTRTSRRRRWRGSGRT